MVESACTARKEVVRKFMLCPLPDSRIIKIDGTLVFGAVTDVLTSPMFYHFLQILVVARGRA